MTDVDGISGMHVEIARGTLAIESAIREASAAAAVGRCILVACLVPFRYHSVPYRQGWQFSLSRCGQPPVVVSRHPYKRDVEGQAVRLHRANSEGDLRDDAAFAELIQELAAFSDGAVE